MTRYYRRRRPGTKETIKAAVIAAGAAAGVGLVTFYLTRIFLSRELLGRSSSTPERPDDEPGESREA